MLLHSTTRLLTRPAFFTARNTTNIILRSIHADAGAKKDAYIELLKGEQEGIAILKLDRPAARNALSVKLLGEFRDALAQIRFSRYIYIRVYSSHNSLHSI